MPRSVLLTLTCAIALSTAACDRESTDAAQPQQTQQSGDSEQLTGTIDRSHAGEPIPALSLTDAAGTTLDLAKASGKPILINLWATWCAPCVEEMPLLDKLAADKGEQLRVLTVSEDLKGAEAVKPFFEEKGYKNLPMWLDTDNELAIAYGGGGALPLTILYDAEGKEVWRVNGGYDWSGAEARKAIEEVLASAA